MLPNTIYSTVRSSELLITCRAKLHVQVQVQCLGYLSLSRSWEALSGPSCSLPASLPFPSLTSSPPSFSPCQTPPCVHLTLSHSFFSFSFRVCWRASKSQASSSCPNTDGPPQGPAWFHASYYCGPTFPLLSPWSPEKRADEEGKCDEMMPKGCRT